MGSEMCIRDRLSNVFCYDRTLFRLSVYEHASIWAWTYRCSLVILNSGLGSLRAAAGGTGVFLMKGVARGGRVARLLGDLVGEAWRE